MASAYALPSTNGSAEKHARFPSLNGMPFDASPDLHVHHDQDHFDPDGLASKGHTHTHSHSNSHSQRLPMKGRIRGESDLGRPNEKVRATHAHHHDTRSVEIQSPLPDGHGLTIESPSFSLLEVSTALFIPLQYIFASVAYSPLSPGLSFPPLSAYAAAHLRTSQDESTGGRQVEQTSAFVQACTLTSGTLLLAGILAQIRSSERALDRRKRSDPDLQAHATGLLSMRAIQKMGKSMLSVGLPFYAAMQLGGMRVGLLILTAFASGMTGVRPHGLIRNLSSHSGLCAVLLLCAIADFVGLTLSLPLSDMALGYLALALSVFALPLPLPALSSVGIHNTGAARPMSATAASPLISSASDTTNTLAAGLVLAVFTIGASVVLSAAPAVSILAITCSTLAMASTSGLILMGQPAAMQASKRMAFALACLMTAASSFLFSPNVWPGTVTNGGLSALAFFGALYDTGSRSIEDHSDHHDHVHTGHSHKHHQHHDAGDVSFLTRFLLARVQPGSLVSDILREKDSRRIAYFTCLNFIFMLVQAFYGWVSGSLGLLSDTVHMFFDCLALVVGLAASVAAKWPTSPEKPYGWGKLNTLAGFGNGIFLMLVSVEFVWEAVEGMMEGTELRHVEELLVVSTLGLLVNMVGLLAFGHAHAGHDHGHGGHSHGHGHAGHSHGHEHNHDHGHSHSHSHGHTHTHAPSMSDAYTHGPFHEHSHSHSHAHSPSHANGSLYAPQEAHAGHGHGHGHGHDNDNMHGIYLHVAADAGGSLAVILSTALNLWRPWYVWDPLATILIAGLIFAAAVPLVKESGKKLLLVVPDEAEWGLKNALQELSTMRGVTGYAKARFWIEDKGAEADSHGHGHHHHDHGHSHGHDAGEEAKDTKMMGVIHVSASRAASAEDVRQRVVHFFRERDIDIVAQVDQS